jgi:hypothetical protein
MSENVLYNEAKFHLDEEVGTVEEKVQPSNSCFSVAIVGAGVPD